MPDPKISIKPDKAAIDRDAQEIGISFADGFVKNFEKAANKLPDIIKNTLGATALQKIDPKQLSSSAIRGMEGLVRNTQFKNETAKVARVLSTSIEKDLGINVDPKAIQSILSAGLKQTEQDTAQKRGLISKLLWGKEGIEGNKQQVRQMSNMLFYDLMGQFGKAGKIAGMLPANIQSYGIAGGLGVTGAQAGISLIGSAVQKYREQEGMLMNLAPVMGGTREARRAITAGWGAGFTQQEVTPFAGAAGRAGAGGGLGSILRAERTAGMGGDMTQMLGSLAQRGQTIDRTRARQEWIRIFSTGLATGLDRGRWGELARGLGQMVQERGVGGRLETKGVADFLTRVGSVFKGQEGIEAARGIENMVRAPKTMLGRAMALQAVGLGTARSQGGVGGDIFGAERRMERGFFGEGGLGPEAIEKMVGRFKDIFGVKEAGKEIVGDEAAEMRRGQLIKEMASNTGLTQNATEQMISAIEGSTLTTEKMNKIVEMGKSKEEKAFDAMIGLGALKGVDVKFDRLLAVVADGIAPAIRQVAGYTGNLADGLAWLFKGDIGGIMGALKGGKLEVGAEAQQNIQLAKSLKDTIDRTTPEVLSKSTQAVITQLEKQQAAITTDPGKYGALAPAMVDTIQKQITATQRIGKEGKLETAGEYGLTPKDMGPILDNLADKIGKNTLALHRAQAQEQQLNVKVDVHGHPGAGAAQIQKRTQQRQGAVTR